MHDPNEQRSFDRRRGVPASLCQAPRRTSDETGEHGVPTGQSQYLLGVAGEMRAPGERRAALGKADYVVPLAAEKRAGAAARSLKRQAGVWSRPKQRLDEAIRTGQACAGDKRPAADCRRLKAQAPEPAGLSALNASNADPAIDARAHGTVHGRARFQRRCGTRRARAVNRAGGGQSAATSRRALGLPIRGDPEPLCTDEPVSSQQTRKARKVDQREEVAGRRGGEGGGGEEWASSRPPSRSESGQVATQSD